MTKKKDPFESLDEQMEEVKEELGGDKKRSEKKGSQKDENEEKGPNLENSPFPSDEVLERSMYFHKKNWSEWDTMRLEIQTILKKHGVKNPMAREVDDALIDLAKEKKKEVAKKALKKRDIDPQEDLF